MAKEVKRGKRSTVKQSAYLTKRAIANAAKRGFGQAAKETLLVMGYNVVAKGGFVVKVDKDGNVVEKISAIPGYRKKRKIYLD